MILFIYISRLQYLAVVEERRLESIRESDPDIYEAVYWVRRNQDQSVKHVSSRPGKPALYRHFSL